jgi:CheY-like chemotaxis protein
VLVVDDNPDMRDTFALLLQHAGFEPLTAAGGADALRLVAERRPAAVVSELLLQDVDGLVLGRWLRTLAGPSLVLVAHTTSIASDIRQRAQQAGYDRFVSKPADPQAMLDLLRQACR